MILLLDKVAKFTTTRNNVIMSYDVITIEFQTQIKTTVHINYKYNTLFS